MILNLLNIVIISQNKMITFIKIVIFLFFSISLFSCKISGTTQGLFSYYEKTISKNPNLIIDYNDTLLACSKKYSLPTQIYISNGIMLEKCINNQEKTIVYIWKPRCKSKICYPLNIIQQKCDENNIELYIVAEYFDNEMMSKTYQLKNVILGIDTKYYKSNLTAKYKSKFIFDLTKKEYVEENFMFFEKGKLVKCFDKIDEIK